MEELTRRQAQVLDLVRSWIDDTGYPPTRADIARTLGFRSPNAAEEHLRALQRKGEIELVAGTSRGIRLPAGHGIPIVGHVAAGYPVLAEEHIEDHCEIPPGFFRPRAHYMLRVRGASMRDAGILDGDLLAVHNSSDAANGQIVVARLGDEVTVKRLKRTRSRYQIVLQPENDEFEPINIDLRERECTIEGIGVGVIRRDGR